MLVRILLEPQKISLRLLQAKSPQFDSIASEPSAIPHTENIGTSSVVTMQFLFLLNIKDVYFMEEKVGNYLKNLFQFFFPGNMEGGEIYFFSNKNIH